MLKTGFLSATSVGFIPLKYNFVDDPQRRFGIDFLEQELLEFSIVTVPANAEALIEGRGLEPAPIIPVAETLTPVEFSLDLAQRRLAVARLRAA
jgi:phage head maturation protease